MGLVNKIFFTLILLSCGRIFGQFTTTGDASAVGCNCFDLTDDIVSENGSFYKTGTINLNTAFQFKFSVNFGCADLGGEGLAFVLKSGGWATGAGGYGLGYQGIAGNNLSIEFDTRDNDASGEISNNDIPADHISLQDNGDIDHAPANPNNLLGIPSGLNIGEVPTPHEIKPGSPNLEDCEDHLVEISWTPGPNQTLQVKVDNIVTLTYIGNMIASQFGGNPNVLWGWTGSTGAVAANLQTVCLAVLPNFTFSADVCPGDLVSFTDESLTFYPIASWNWDFDGLGTSTLENPSFTFDEAGNYDVELTITDSEGCDNTVTIAVPVGFETGVSADDTTLCPDGSTTLHATANPFLDTECCFKLVLNDLWGDYWGSGTANEIEILVDGTTFGYYTPTSYDPGSGTSDTIDLCFETGTELDFIIHGEDSPAECSYYFLDDDLTEIIVVNGADPGAWEEGATESYTVDCGIIAPAYTYLWDNAPLLSDITIPNPIATVSTDTWFHVAITDPITGCVIIDSILILVHPPVDAIISGSTTVCEGETGELTITFTGPAPYTVDVTGPGGALPTITDIVVSPYTLEVTDEGDYIITYVTGDGCVGTFSGTGALDVVVPFDIDIEASATYCDGEPIADLVVVSTGGGAVNWYDNPGLIPPVLATGLSFSPPSLIGTTSYYAAETESVLGCVGAVDEVTITVYPIPPAPAYTGETAYCEGDDATPLFGEPSLSGTMTWYDDLPPGGGILSTDISFTPTLSPPGITIYITETADGCESPPTEIVITVSPTPDPPTVTGEIAYCEGEEATALTAIPSLGGNIEWRTEGGLLLGSGISFTPTLVVGETVILVYEILGGCTSEPTTVTISVQAFPTISLPDQVAICLGDSVEITAINNGYTITWSDGQEGETVWLNPTITTLYTATATNPECGSATDDITVVVYNLPNITASNDTTIGAGGEVILWAASTNATVFTWSPSVLNCIAPNCSSILDVPDRATAYVVTVTDNHGCKNTDTIFVDINGTMDVFVPNVFSPNGDGSNDYLIVYGPHLFNFNIEIYDRWGKRVFETKDQKNYWDGIYKDELLSPQTFVYWLTGETVLGQPIKIEGNVTIIK